MSSRRRRTSPSISSYVGLIRFYEEVEEQVKISPYVMLAIAILTPLVVLILRALYAKP